NSGLFDNDKRLADYTDAEWEALLHGPDPSVEFSTEFKGFERDYEGLVDKFNRLYINKDLSSKSEETREAVNQVMSSGTCPLCNGTRLSQEALSSTINGYNIAQ